MCGLAGFIGTAGNWSRTAPDVAARMCGAITHRGPDDSGVWSDDSARVVLGHRRLSIVDLSESGHQPMQSACGRYIAVFNGEIYNHLQLREELAFRDWRGHSDTETLLHCFSHYGVPQSLHKMVGMFAIAVWDRVERQLTLARDRLGEKPLYYGTLPSGEFIFGSELKALRVHPRWQGEVDRDALALYLRHNCIPAPWSIYKGIKKLEPGRWITVRPGSDIEQGSYWNAREVAFQAQTARVSPLSDAQAIDGLEALLTQVVRGQMLADVPLGAFLSGGVDSSTIVALMTKLAPQRVKTFSVGFSEAGYNEAENARAVAEHLETDHTELYVTANDALSVVPMLPSMYDEPFADSSQIPTYLVAKLARSNVTVALSGDGGDELFAGYSRYLLAQTIWRWLGRWPLGLRQLMAKGVLSIRPAAWDSLTTVPLALLPRRWRIRAAGDKLHKFAGSVLPAHSSSGMYRALVSHWQDPAAVVLNSSEPRTILQDEEIFSSFLQDVERMNLCDQLTYLPDDVLVKVDRAAMAVSLETRVPLLDHRVVEYAWQLPMHQKIRDGQTKWLLRQVLYRHVPRRLIDRPKQGFAVPLDQWLRGPLRDWAESLIAPERLTQEGFFDTVQVRTKWEEHISGVRNWQYLIWDVLMFQAWMEETIRLAARIDDAA